MPSAPDRLHVAETLRRIAGWIRFRGEKGFRARAYETGATSIESVTDLAAVAAAGKLTSLPGIGAGLAAQITEILATGTSSYLDELRDGLPVTLPALAEAAALSPARVLTAHRELGITDYDALVAAARAGKLRDLAGFGMKTETRLAAQAAPTREAARGLNLEDADALLDELVAHLRRDPHVLEVTVAGERRRACELVACVAVVVQTSDPSATLAHAKQLAAIVSVSSSDETSFVAEIPRAALRVVAVAPTESGLALLQTTGPVEHATRVQELLLAASASTSTDNESELYARAGLPFIPPEQRDDPRVIDAALDGARWADLVTWEDLRGVVHCHTTFSDGKNSILEMARAAEALGLSYITITDHSPTAHYAHGVELDRLKRQWDEINEAQAEVGIRILRGTESDITRDGALDYPDEVLEKLDVIVASVHNRYKLDKDQMTERVVRAMRHPCMKIWGHALGRILQQREPYDCHVEKILDAIAESRAVIELNGDPHRLDLPPALVPLARERGIAFVLSADAHSTRALGYLHYAVAMARRAGVTKREVLNTRATDAFLAAVRPAA